MTENEALRRQIAALERRIAALERAGPMLPVHEIRDIAEAVCAAFGIDTCSIYRPSSRMPQVLARQVVMKIALDRHIGSTIIGQAFGMDHTTVLYAARSVRRRAERDAEFAVQYTAIEKSLPAIGQNKNDAHASIM